MRDFLLVALGGALGSSARYGVGLLAARWPDSFPWGTLCVNVLGSFALGALAHVFATNSEFSREKRLFLATGCLGGFTTYSSFNQETLARFNTSGFASGALYIAVTVVLCLAAGWFGTLAARAAFGT